MALRLVKDEKGYTLIESLVAMMLFGGVLIPLLGMMSNLMFDKRSLDTYKAFLVAESEMNRIVTEEDYGASGVRYTGGFRTETSIEIHDQMVRVKVSVTPVLRSETKLIELNKTVLLRSKTG